MEEDIEKLRKENSELTKKISLLRNSHVIQSKQLDTCSKNKKYPSQINSYTEEVKNLVAKKHQYYNKMLAFKKSISNVKSYFSRVVKYFNEVLTSGRYNANPRPIQENIELLEQELQGTEDEIIDRCLRGVKAEGKKK